MLTKRQTIELIENRLAGAGTTADLRRRYPRAIIEAIIGKVYADIAFTNAYMMQDLANTYDISYTETTLSTGKCEYSAILSVNPLGSFSFVSVEFGDKFYPMQQGKQEGFVMNKVMPNRIAGCYLRTADKGWKLIFTEKPILENGTATYVPDFRSMDDNAPLLFNGGEVALYKAVVELIKYTDQRPGEEFNDGTDDLSNIPPKPQIVE